jgi:alcohol dehydrogenase/L-iditol 2-dehydrogenase
MPKTMPAVVHYEHRDHAVELREVPLPEIGRQDVLMQVRSVSVCGSDVHMWRNMLGHKPRVPVILGHEFSGVVAEVGADVRGFKEGDRVASETAAEICGRCMLCRTGQYNLCPERKGYGHFADGAMTQYVRVPSRALHHLPDRLPFRRSALLEPSAVAYHSTAVNTHIAPGDLVVVLGPGPIGLLALQVARLQGAGRVFISGMKEDAPRLDIAVRRLGADRAIDASAEDPVEVVRAAGDGLGADVVIDAVGVSATLQQSIAMVRPGGQITKVGWGPAPVGFSLDPLVAKAARLQGSFSHNYRTWERVIELVTDGKLDVDGLISRVAPLEGWHEAFERMEQRVEVKAVLTPNGPV